MINLPLVLRLSPHVEIWLKGIHTFNSNHLDQILLKAIGNLNNAFMSFVPPDLRKSKLFFLQYSKYTKTWVKLMWEISSGTTFDISTGWEKWGGGGAIDCRVSTCF